MKLQKQLSRKVGDVEYAKWVLVIPPNIIEELKWKEGQEVEAEIKENKLIMKKTSLNRFASQVVDVMPLMVREFAKREDNDFARGKISCPQMVALHHTAQRGRVTVSEISRILNISKSSASVLLDRLVRQKLMTRRQDDRDRRIVWVAVTGQGKKVVSQILSQKRRSVKAVFGPLTPHFFALGFQRLNLELERFTS